MMMILILILILILIYRLLIEARRPGSLVSSTSTPATYKASLLSYVRLNEQSRGGSSPRERLHSQVAIASIVASNYGGEQEKFGKESSGAAYHHEMRPKSHHGHIIRSRHVVTIARSKLWEKTNGIERRQVVRPVKLNRRLVHFTICVDLKFLGSEYH